MRFSPFVTIAIVVIVIVGGGYWLLTNDTSMQDIDEDNLESGSVIHEETVSYFDAVQGFYARPDAPGEYPGVVMIHEWWGLNENIKDMARSLAREGYQVLAVDLYRGEVAETRERANELRLTLDQEEATENLRAAAAYLRNQGASKMASLGWCFGGGQSLQLALSGEKLDATVIYYGTLVTDQAELSRISWPVLGIFGETDQSIPPQHVREFENALNAIGVSNEIHIYPGVGHAFANPSGDNFAPGETEDAWEKTLTFLERALQ